MSQIESQVASNVVETQPTTAQQAQPVAPTIAVRKSCNPDGIGLSHYVLMDRKAAK
jgi:modified peptide precursor CbpA